MTARTYSEVSAFRQCRAKWGYSYHEGLRPDVDSTPLVAGRLYHDAVAAGIRAMYASRSEVYAYAAQGGALCAAEALERAAEAVIESATTERAQAAARESWDESREWLRYQVRHWFEAHGVDTLQQYALLSDCELSFDAVLPDGRRFAGQIDLPLYHFDHNAVVVLDHKTTSGPVDGLDGRIMMDDQTTGYLWALRELHREGRLEVPSQDRKPRFVGVAYDVARKRCPAMPKLNKLAKRECDPAKFDDLKELEARTGINRGVVSSAAIDTTAQLYRAALEEQAKRLGVEPTAKQLDVLRRLEDAGETYQARIAYHRTEADLDRWQREFRSWCDEIEVAERNESRRMRNVGACSGVAAYRCPYTAMCMRGEPESTRQGNVVGFVRLTTRHPELQDSAQKETEVHGDQEADFF